MFATRQQETGGLRTTPPSDDPDAADDFLLNDRRHRASGSNQPQSPAAARPGRGDAPEPSGRCWARAAGRGRCCGRRACQLWQNITSRASIDREGRRPSATALHGDHGGRWPPSGRQGLDAVDVVRSAACLPECWPYLAVRHVAAGVRRVWAPQTTADPVALRLPSRQGRLGTAAAFVGSGDWPAGRPHVRPGPPGSARAACGGLGSPSRSQRPSCRWCGLSRCAGAGIAALTLRAMRAGRDNSASLGVPPALLTRDTPDGRAPSALRLR